MRFFFIPAILPLALLIGCASNAAPKTVEASAPQIAQTDPHRYSFLENKGNPIMLDSETGKVWKFDGEVLVPVVYKGDSPLQPVEVWVRNKKGILVPKTK